MITLTLLALLGCGDDTEVTALRADLDAALNAIDDDGSLDLVLGAWEESSAWGYAGAVYIVPTGYSGTVTLASAAGIIELSGASANDYAGYAMATTDDVTADGIADLLVGAPGESSGGVNTGTVYLIEGSSSLSSGSIASATVLEMWGSTGDEAGTSVAFQDLDADGLSEMIVGAPGYDNGTVADAA